MRSAMIYDLSKKITYCSAKDINHATSSIQIVASALKKIDKVDNLKAQALLDSMEYNF